MDNDNYITINEQGLAEVNPTASSDMQNAFIDAYRNIQGENTAQIGTQAHALGSDLEAQYGGLHGPSEYMKSRYQTPQTESRIAGLRTASQLSALNQLMQNDVASWKDKYSQAYRDAQKRARQRAAAAATTPQTPKTPIQGGVDETPTSSGIDYSTHGTNVPGLDVNQENYADPDGNWITRNMDSGEILYINGMRPDVWEEYKKRQNGTSTQKGGGGGGSGW